MFKKENFTVVKLVEQSGRSYVGIDYVKGQALCEYVRKNPDFTKEVFFDFIKELANQLLLFHAGNKNLAYQYVNPLGIIISEERKVFLLDTEAKENTEIVREMQKQSIREQFLPLDTPYYQKHMQTYDVYSYGRVVQFVLSYIKVEPKLSKREEAVIQKAVRKCLSMQIDFSEVVKALYSLNRNKAGRKFEGKTFLKRHKKVALFAGSAILAAMLACMYANSRVRQVKAIEMQAACRSNVSKETERIKMRLSLMQQEKSENERLLLDIGMLYLVELDDLHYSQYYFKQIEDKEKRDILTEIISGMLALQAEGDEEQLESALSKEKSLRINRNCLYMRGIVKGLQQLSSGDAREMQLAVIEDCLQRKEEKEFGLSEATEWEFNKYKATIYEEKGEIQEAISQYNLLLTGTEGEKEKEYVYRKIVTLFQAENDTQQALTFCVTGVNELPSSLKLRLLAMDLQLSSDDESKSQSISLAQHIVDMDPKWLQEEEFANKMTACGLLVEEGIVRLQE